MVANWTWLLWTSFLSGFAVMAAEMSGARLLAPYVGTSTMVWALLIGAVMASLAIGNMIGGHVASKSWSLRAMFGGLMMAGIILALLPILGRSLLQESLGWFRQSAFAAMIASTSVVLVLLVVPMVALGATSPILVQHAVTSKQDTGRTAGKLYAFGTMGSLVGTYLSGIVLVPLLGTSRTFWICAAALMIQGLVGITKTQRRAAGAIVVAGCAAFLPPGVVRADSSVVFEKESIYNYIQVREKNNVRGLYLNEGFAVQSVLPLDGSPPQSGVWQYYAAAPAWTTHGRPKRLLMLGLGGGAAARAWEALYPDAELVGVEIDPEIVRVARDWMMLPRKVEVNIADARPFLANETRKYDVIIVDAFQFPYIPFQLTTIEFFRELDRNLEKGGVALLNVGRYREGKDVVHAIGRTASEVFPRISAADVYESNTILVLSRHMPTQDLGIENVDTKQRLHRLRYPLLPYQPPADARVLSDDIAPVEWLTDAVLVRTVLKMW